MSAVGLDGVYTGAADLIVDEARYAVRVRLKGSVNPFDGHYHWQGTVFEAPDHVKPAGTPVRLRVDGHDAVGRLVERTADGHLMISGTGRPPYPL